MGLKLGCQTYGWLAYANEHDSTFSYKLVLAEVAKTGFVGVDMTGGFYDGMPDPVDCKAECDALGVKLVCFSADVDDVEKAREVIEYLQANDGAALMVGGGFVPEGEDREAAWMQLIADANAMAELSREMAFPIGFHNHLWSLTETPEEIERFMAETDIAWCPDIGHMASGGADPQEFLRRYGERAVHCHLKDSVVDAQGKHVRFCELGKGNSGVDVDACLKILVEKGFDGWACVEQDQTSLTPFADQKYNHDYLEGLGYAAALKGE